MSYNAKLKFNGGSDYKVLSANYSVSRTSDQSGRVASDPSNALIRITVEATDKSDLLESLLNGKFKPTKVEVEYAKAHEEGKMITMQWENGYVIQHEVNFNSTDDKSMVISFMISAETIKYGNSEYKGNWPQM
jgi:hypothetical protein